MQQWCCLLALTWNKRLGSRGGTPQTVTCVCHQQSYLSKQCTPHKISILPVLDQVTIWKFWIDCFILKRGEILL